MCKPALLPGNIHGFQFDVVFVVQGVCYCVREGSEMRREANIKVVTWLRRYLKP